ncbi:MAG: RagB/SusD family nutrient uptake outer membrane protein [Gemmatimonas sp.]|nr:RagB/SusD family nutrient uptake outer membrane protein [Gemmatimonas sp.]
MYKAIQRLSFGRRAGQALIVGASLGVLNACDSLLEAEIPHLLTDDAIETEASAESQINSVIALFECGYTAFGLRALGHEDAMESIAGVFSGSHVYSPASVSGACDANSTSVAWLDQIMGARALISNDPAKLVSTGQGLEGVNRGVYDRINDEWALGPAGERLSAIAAIYMGASLAHLGEFMCEAAIDGSDLLTPTDLLNLAEDWITNRALGHIGSFGDFVMPFGVASSAEQMAIAIRARIRWANRDYAGAAVDAATVLAADPTFTAWVTREAGETRRNKIYHNATEVGFSGGLGINSWWNPAIRRPNPVTGASWPDPIPFTGYLFLGIMPDGRTLEAGNVPVRWAEELRDVRLNPILLENDAVADTRVQHVFKSIQGPAPREVPNRYSGNDDDVPYMTWEELRLIQADNELAQGNLQGAIDHVNALRTAHGLPTIADPYLSTLIGDAEQVRYVLLEERRREFFAEGARYYSTKIQNTDVLWFPRAEGQTPFQGYNLQGGVRTLLPDEEYQQNPYFIDRGGLDARGTGCASLPGSQAPFIQ